MQDQDFAIASLLLQDQQRLIAAGKVQRWDVVKWTTAVNLALATASVGIGTSVAGIIIVVFTILVALGGRGSRLSLPQANYWRVARC